MFRGFTGLRGSGFRDLGFRVWGFRVSGIWDSKVEPGDRGFKHRLSGDPAIHATLIEASLLHADLKP